MFNGDQSIGDVNQTAYDKEPTQDVEYKTGDKVLAMMPCYKSNNLFSRFIRLFTHKPPDSEKQVELVCTGSMASKRCVPCEDELDELLKNEGMTEDCLGCDYRRAWIEPRDNIAGMIARHECTAEKPSQCGRL